MTANRKVTHVNAIVDEEGNWMKLDPKFGSIPVNNLKEWSILNGRYFRFNCKKDVQNNESISVAFTTPPDKYIWFFPGVDVEREVEVFFYLGIDDYSSGEAVDSLNADDGSDFSVSQNILCDPTNVTLGTPKEFKFSLGSDDTAGGERKTSGGFILARDTKYLIEVFNRASPANMINIRASYIVLDVPSE
jgi:hypothetical protein